MDKIFKDRREAGRLLAEALSAFKETNTVVLGLPRGGVPVAYEVATGLGLPLNVLICRKLGVPGRDEYAFGAIAEGGICFINSTIVRSIGLTESQIKKVQAAENRALRTREKLFRTNAPVPNLQGKTALVIDDGLATGASARAASVAARQLGAERVVVAVPVGPRGAENSIPAADEVICLNQPAMFLAVGNNYEEFPQVSDAEVLLILERNLKPI